MPSTIWSPTVKTGLSEVIGSWKIIDDLVAAQLAHLRRLQLQEIDAFEADLAAGDAAGRLRDQAHDRERGHALAAAGLADDAERAARRQREADAVDRAKLAAIDREVRAQVPHFEQRARLGRAGGPRAGHGVGEGHERVTGRSSRRRRLQRFLHAGHLGIDDGAVVDAGRIARVGRKRAKGW